MGCVGEMSNAVGVGVHVLFLSLRPQMKVLTGRVDPSSRECSKQLRTSHRKKDRNLQEQGCYYCTD